MNSDNLLEAKELIKKGESIKKVARKLDIEYVPLYNHIKGINRSFNKGRPKLLPFDVETELTNIASYLASRGTNLGLNFRRFKNFAGPKDASGLRPAKDIYKSLHPTVLCPEDKMLRPIFSLRWWRKFKQR